MVLLTTSFASICLFQLASCLNFWRSFFVEGRSSPCSREQLLVLGRQHRCLLLGSHATRSFSSLIIERDRLLEVLVHQPLLISKIDQKRRPGYTIQKLIHHLLFDSGSCQHLLLSALEQVLHEDDARVNFVYQ